nr:MAG TPA: hypothetical protein [Caudoviricetes sp.]
MTTLDWLLTESKIFLNYAVMYVSSMKDSVLRLSGQMKQE